MDLNNIIEAVIAKKSTRPKAIRLSLDAFNQLEKDGHITRGAGGPNEYLEWASGVPWYSGNIYAWCDPSFRGMFELPTAEVIVNR